MEGRNSDNIRGLKNNQTNVFMQQFQTVSLLEYLQFSVLFIHIILPGLYLRGNNPVTNGKNCGIL